MSSMSRTLLAGLVLVGLVGTAPAAEAGEHHVGLGVHYWQTVDDLFDGAGLADDGLSLLLSYQYVPVRGLLRFELDLEYFDDGFGGSDGSAVAPVGYVVVGRKLYVAGGLGVTFASGLEGDVSDPFFAGRIGYQLGLLPGLKLDLNVNYRTNAFSELGDFDTDTLSLGAIVRLKL